MKKHISLLFLISLPLAVISFVILRLCNSSMRLADALNSTVCTVVRRAFSLLSDLVPFSVFELLLCISPIAVILLAVISVRVFRARRGRIKFISRLAGIVLTIYTFYIFTLAIPYRVTPVSDSIGLTEIEVTEDNLYRTAMSVVEELNALAGLVDREGGVAKMPYDIDTLSEKISDAYSAFVGQYEIFPDFDSRAKPIHFSGVMSTLRLLGIYTFFTGESNINVAYPDFDRPYTVAHEFSHQRGVLRENEANFVAFLVCIGSDDVFIRYSGYLRLYEYLSSSLYSTDQDLWREVAQSLDPRCYDDIRASNAVTEKYGETVLGEISNKLNDAYLKHNGTEGVISYGLVTRLAVSYYESK